MSVPPNVGSTLTAGVVGSFNAADAMTDGVVAPVKATAYVSGAYCAVNESIVPWDGWVLCPVSAFTLGSWFVGRMRAMNALPAAAAKFGGGFARVDKDRAVTESVAKVS